MITSAFTCTGPHAVLIMLGIKRVENRSMMPVPERGRCAVGCSKTFCKEEYGAFVQWASRVLPPEDFELIPAWSDVKDWPGKIVGACDYAARSRGTRDPTEAWTRGSASFPVVAGQPPYQWDEGCQFWWDLSEVACFDIPISCRGNVGMWQKPPALASQVTAADTLARRVGETIATSEDAARLFRWSLPVVGNREGFFLLPLDGERRVLSAPVLVSLGHENGTAAIDSGMVLSEALKAGASAIIVAHNHPSGDLTPSMADVAATREMKNITSRIGIAFLAHLIVDSVGGKGAVQISET